MSEHIARQVTDLFGLIYRNLIRSESDRVSANADSQTALLSVLMRNGPTNMSEIGKLLNVTKPNVTFLVDRMEEQKLVRREKTAEDRRVYQICLTDAGRALVETKKTELQERIVSKLDRLSAEDEKALREAMETAAQILRKLYDSADDDAERSEEQ